jgi:exopolyphosphatase/pppGpp-phosphohydrolase
VTTDPQLAQAPLLLMDVGGGSAQFTFGSDGHTQFRHSFPLGSVRLLETIPCSDPPKPAELAACRQWLKDFLKKEVRPKLTQEKGSPSGAGDNWWESAARRPSSGAWKPSSKHSTAPESRPPA